MPIKTHIPCCEHRGAAHVSLLSRPRQDRICPHCRSWWRADVRLISDTAKAQCHAVEWTFVGKIANHN